MNSENSKLLIHVGQYLALLIKTFKRSAKYVGLSDLIIYNRWKNKNNELKKSTPTWNDEFELLVGSFSVTDTQY